MWWDLHCSHQEHKWQSRLLHSYGRSSVGVAAIRESWFRNQNTICVCVYLHKFEIVWLTIMKVEHVLCWLFLENVGQTPTSQFVISHIQYFILSLLQDNHFNFTRKFALFFFSLQHFKLWMLNLYYFCQILCFKTIKIWCMHLIMLLYLWI